MRAAGHVGVCVGIALDDPAAAIVQFSCRDDDSTPHLSA
jgi:hypothetical protein